MKSDEMAAKMRLGECFHELRALQGAYIVIRVDGRSFSRLTERTCEKPFDTGFHRQMTDAAKAVLTSLHGSYAHAQSDEISILLPHATNLFDREVEKPVSVAASSAAAILGEQATMRSRARARPRGALPVAPILKRPSASVGRSTEG
ncbi:tRNA(His) guanylyltransferase Thg1 family protein [Sorangium sp. So ce1000]|uniref:tRNA(His) guanylyltransferase Thg1 family protein n=1 Tax=Sorangium sp. So ce1000 TaxID=3133325 RepID=UPI003F5E64FB